MNEELFDVVNDRDEAIGQLPRSVVHRQGLKHRAVHVLLFIFFFAFIFMHVYLSSLGHTPSAHFKAMITGYEDVEEPGTPGAPHAAGS